MVQCGENKKVIDYNDLITEKLNKLQEMAEAQKQSELDEDEEGFKAGLFAREVAVTQEEVVEPEITPEEILEDAQKEAKEILEEANQQIEELKQQAYQEASKMGYEEGYQQAISDVEEQKQQIKIQREKLAQDYQKQLEEMEPMLVDAITTVVQSVFKVKMEDDRDIIIHLLKASLGQIENSKEFIVKVSKEDYPFVLKYKEVLDKTITRAAEIAIIEDISLTKNQCLIETDGGVFDCSLDVQLDNLIKTLKTLSLN